MPFDNNRYVDNSAYFTHILVKLIDGFIGQVMWGEEIVHQTELKDSAEDAVKAAREATLAAVKRLFA